MNLTFDNSISIVDRYHSKTQIARVLTENWVNQNMYCPRCGNKHIKHFENNRPVADFYCPSCNNEYELKSKSGNLGHKINDGAFKTMIERITSNDNPDFFLMSYSKEESKVKDFILIPKHFFVPDIIEMRKPLAPTARRAGWIGCNILIDKIPKQGMIDIISNGEVTDINKVVDKVNRSNQLETKDMSSRSWLMDVLNCVNKISSESFTLDEMYQFENLLHIKHPQNNNIKPKIRQQLQFLRDRGFIEFLGNGKYIKIM
ncbi:MAG: DpnI domain-containing protein [Erysipelotrichia bacterium]|nr:DpnI domain-containing protein [Erysipelotrichia bacterium]